jgi:hypothetical protein
MNSVERISLRVTIRIQSARGANRQREHVIDINWPDLERRRDVEACLSSLEELLYAIPRE